MPTPESQMNVQPGADIGGRAECDCDVAVIGSGPAGATVARDLARRGADVAVVERGPWIRPDEMPDDMFTALADMWRDMAASLTVSWPPIPVLQGVVVGGSSVINGAICWRLPRRVYETWCDRDPEFRQAVPWERLDSDFDDIEEDLHITPVEWDEAGRHNQLFAEGAEALDLEHTPTRLNVREDCPHGMRGCPEGNKMSMDRTYLPEACEHGAVIFDETNVEEIRRENGRATAIRGTTSAGGDVTVRADDAVVVAGSAIQSPALLLYNGIRHGPVGEHLQCHPGASVIGRFDESVEMWTGATQGHDVMALEDEGIKLETLGYNPTFAVMRMKALGRPLARELGRLDQWMNGGIAIRGEAEGQVRPKANGEAKVWYTPTRDDFAKIRKGASVLGEMLLAAGAEEVSLGPPGWTSVTDIDEAKRFREDGPLSPESYEMILSHLFGTCRMGSDPAESVVDLGFEHHDVDRLFVADSSVFPSNLGVNPQLSIIAMARQCARSIAERTGR